MLKRVFASLLLFVALFTGCAAVGPKMPAPQSGAQLIADQPVAFCSERVGIYMEQYDLNPNTKAALTYYGYFEVAPNAPNSQPTKGEAVLAILTDDEGKPTIHILEKGKVLVITQEEFRARFTEPCDLLKIVEMKVSSLTKGV